MLVVPHNIKPFPVPLLHLYVITQSRFWISDVRVMVILIHIGDITDDFIIRQSFLLKFLISIQPFLYVFKIIILAPTNVFEWRHKVINRKVCLIYCSGCLSYGDDCLSYYGVFFVQCSKFLPRFYQCRFRNLRS